MSEETSSTSAPAPFAAPPGFHVIREGQASVLVPKGNQVFYNNVQEFNRDLSIMVLTQYAEIRKAEFEVKAQKWIGGADERATKKAKYSKTPVELPTVPLTMDDVPERLKYKGLRIFEALSASGLRSIRYFKEIPLVDTVHVNDMDPSAVASIQRNVMYNQLPLDRVIPNQNDATSAMYMNRANSLENIRQKATKDAAKQEAPMESPVAEDDPLAWLYKPLPVVPAAFQPPVMRPWDCIDLDPYGSATPFLDSAIQAVESGGILAITCTDMGVLCGNYSETCFAKYGGMPLQGPYCHEMGLRVLLHTVETIAARYQRTIEPLLSFSIDFYCRIFVRIHSSALNAKFSASKQALVYSCVNCKAFHIQKLGKHSNENLAEGEKPADPARVKFTPATGPPVGPRCTDCGAVFKIGGPIWAGALHDPVFAQRCHDYTKANTHRFRTHERMLGMLEMATHELPTPLYFSPPAMSNVLHTSTPKSDLIISALVNAGYKVSETHCSAGSMKTNAPMTFLWDIMRAFVCLPETEPPKTMTLPKAVLAGAGIKLRDGNPLEFTEEEKKAAAEVKLLNAQQVIEIHGKAPGTMILAQPISYPIDFTYRKYTGVKKVTMFFPNPEQFWGPKAMAGIFATDKNIMSTDPHARFTDDAAMNSAQQLALAQQEKSKANQGKRGKRKESTQENAQENEENNA